MKITNFIYSKIKDFAYKIKMLCYKHTIDDIGVFESELGYWELIAEFDENFDNPNDKYRFIFYESDDADTPEITITREQLQDLINFTRQFKTKRLI